MILDDLGMLVTCKELYNHYRYDLGMSREEAYEAVAEKIREYNDHSGRPVEYFDSNYRQFFRNRRYK